MTATAVDTTRPTSSTTLGLYREIRGSGPAVVMIPGATGDAGHFSRTAARLADEFTVVTYDRRGNSRSTSTPRGPAEAAAIAAQADDAAAVIRTAGVGPAIVFGTSGGAIIALELVARQPEVVRAAVVHEPPLLALLPAQDGPDPLQPVFDLAARDKRAALELFVRMNASDGAWTATEAATRERMLGNAGTLFDHEIDAFLSYRPDENALAGSAVPVVLARSVEGLPFTAAIQQLLEHRYGWSGVTVSGHHGPYLDTPEVFAEELRPLLRNLVA